MKILALDQSKSSTGWALWQPGWDKPRFGHVTIGSEYTCDGQTFTKLRSVIIDLYSAVMTFEHIVYEEPIAQKKFTYSTEANVLMLVGLRAVIEGVGYELRCKRRAVSSQNWRTEFCGRDETQMIKRAARQAQKSARDPLKAAVMERCRLLGLSPQNDDEGDAIGILTYAILTNGITPPWLKDEVLRPLAGDVR